MFTFVKTFISQHTTSIKYIAIVLFVAALIYLVYDYATLRHKVPVLEESLNQQQEQYEDYVNMINLERIANNVVQDNNQHIDETYTHAVSQLAQYKDKEQQAKENPVVAAAVVQNEFDKFLMLMQCSTGTLSSCED